MIYFFSAAIMVVFYLDFKLSSVILRRRSAYFEEHKKYGSGEVVGYYAEEGSRWRLLIVKVTELNDNETYICNSAKINTHDYPKGSIVNVCYAITKRGRVQVYLADRLPADNYNMSKFFNIISLISLVITLGLAVAGVMTTLF